MSHSSVQPIVQAAIAVSPQFYRLPVRPIAKTTIEQYVRLTVELEELKSRSVYRDHTPFGIQSRTVGNPNS